MVEPLAIDTESDRNTRESLQPPSSPSKKKEEPLRVYWNSGTWVILTSVFIITMVLWRFQIKEIYEMKVFNCTEKLTNETAPIYTGLGVLTNAAISAGFGKPYTVAWVSAVGFFVSWCSGFFCPRLYVWFEKSMLLIIPSVIIIEYIWIGWYKRRRIYY